MILWQSVLCCLLSVGSADPTKDTVEHRPDGHRRHYIRGQLVAVSLLADAMLFVLPDREDLRCCLTMQCGDCYWIAAPVDLVRDDEAYQVALPPRLRCRLHYEIHHSHAGSMPRAKK